MSVSLQNEIWKDVPGYEGLYMASNHGRIRNFKNNLLKPNKILKGYLHITLHKGGIPKTFRLHRIIAATFIPIDKSRTQVNHKNGIKTDNYIGNLEWCTHTENQRHAYETGLNKARTGVDANNYGKTRGNSCRKKLVINFNTGIFYECAKDAADAHNLTYAQIKNRLQGIVENKTGLAYV